MEVRTMAEQLFFSTIKIETVNADGQLGSGTGFFFALDMELGKVPFIVTNKHVVNPAKSGGFYFQKSHEGNVVLGEGLRVEISEEQWANAWVGHPDPNIDIAVFGVGLVVNELRNELNFDAFYGMISSDLIPSAVQLKEISALEDVVFVGYPNGIWDNFSKLPVIRRGSTATPISVDFEKEPKFLIDASVFGGSSGSPVFVYNNGSYTSSDGTLVISSRLHFVGVVAAVYHKKSLNEIVPVPIPTAVQPMAVQKEMIDLGIVYKARTVVETIEHFAKLHGLR